MELDQTRRDILAATGHLLIEGGPGSGKTTIALMKAAQTVDTLQAEQKVLFLSFSRAAVRQISDRVGEHLTRDTRDHLEIRTFHAFFLDLVRAHGPLLTGTPSVFLPPDAENQIKAGHDGDWDAETHELARRGIYVFDQLAATAATLLERSPALRRLYSDRYPLLIVDEFQDTNIDQWRAIKALSQNSTIICLADPDQRIYDAFVKGIDEARLQHAVDALNPTRFDLAGGQPPQRWQRNPRLRQRCPAQPTCRTASRNPVRHLPLSHDTRADQPLRHSHNPEPLRRASRPATHHRCPCPRECVHRADLRSNLERPDTAQRQGTACP